MKPTHLYHVDAFAESPFKGNPAAVCILENWLPDETLRLIAAELFLPETAFVVKTPGTKNYQLRWFTPDLEMDLCGHATLATAHVLLNELGVEEHQIRFDSAAGTLIVSKEEEELWLDLPSRPAVQTTLPEQWTGAFGEEPDEVWLARDYMLVFKYEQTISGMTPDRAIIDRINMGQGGVIVTAPGLRSDFVSRFFTPQASIFEDPVTGSAHCTLIPYWSRRLNKDKLTAVQLSRREGHLTCINLGNRVLIGGRSVTVAKGIISI